MSTKGIANAEDFKRALEMVNAERVVLPASKLAVLLCRPPVLAALRLGREGTDFQNKITQVPPDEVKNEDILAFAEWITRALTQLFVRPRFAEHPKRGEIGLLDIMVDDLKFIFRWLRGEVLGAGTGDSGLGTGENPSALPLVPGPGTEDLAPFPGQPATTRLSGGSGEAEPVSAKPTARTQRNARVPVGLRRGRSSSAE